MSNQDLKQFSKSYLLGFASAVFHGFLPPEGDLTTKLTMYNNSQTCKHNKKTKFWFSLNFQNIIRRSPQASPTKNWKIKSAVKEKIRDLSSSSKNFERDTYKGGRVAEGAPPPFVGILSHKLFRLVLKPRIFSFQSFLACTGSQISYLVTLDLLKNEFIFFSLAFRNYMFV